MKNRVLLILAWITGVPAVSSQEVSAFYIGHSLSDQIAEMVESMCDLSEKDTFTFAYQSIPGSPLRWSWGVKDREDFTAVPPRFYPFHDDDFGLPSGNHNVLVLTESVPRQRNFDWGISETKLYADSFYRYATGFRPDIRVYLYEVWHCIHSGTPTGCMYDIDSNPWRQRLDDDISMWEEVTKHLNAKYDPEIPVCLIPGGSGLARLYDYIEEGKVPGYDDISQFFSDDIHLTDEGKYLIACIHYATLFGKSPVGLPAQLYSVWGVPFDAPTPEVAGVLQEIAWETVTRYENNCLLETSDENIYDVRQTHLTVFPNPAGNEIFWDIKNVSPDTRSAIYDIYGHKAKEVGRQNAVIGDLPPGMYVIKVGLATSRFVKH